MKVIPLLFLQANVIDKWIHTARKIIETDTSGLKEWNPPVINQVTDEAL